MIEHHGCSKTLILVQSSEIDVVWLVSRFGWDDGWDGGGLLEVLLIGMGGLF